MADEQTQETSGTEKEPTSLLSTGEETTQATSEGEGGGEAGGEKPPAKEEPKAPLTAEDIVIPEGLEVDEPSRASFLEIANKHGLSKDAVADLVNLQAGLAKTVSERGTQAWETTQETWQTEVLSDPEFSGEKTGPAFAEIGKLIDEFGTPELRGVMALTGAGNNIHMIRFLSKAAKAFGEGRPLSGQPGGGKMSPAELMYPTMKKG